MKKEMKERLDELTKLVNREEKSLSSSLNKALIFYLIIIIFLGGYTIFLNIRLRELATPENLAVEINSQIRAAIPRFNHQIRTQMEPGARELAVKSAEGIRNLIPVASEFAKSQLSFYLDEMIDSIEKKHLPDLERVFTETFEEILANKDIVEDEQLAKALATELSERLDKEIAGILDHSFINALNDFRDQIDQLRLKHPDKLTRQEQAEKMFLTYWLFLVEHREVGGGFLSDIANLGNVALEALQSLPIAVR